MIEGDREECPENMTEIRINSRFIYVLRPENVIRVVLVIFAIVFLLAPIDVQGEVSLKAYLYIGLSILSFLLGCSAIFVPKADDRCMIFQVDTLRLRKTYRIFFYLSIIALAFKFYDTIFIRGVKYSLTASTYDNYDAMAEGAGNIFSIISSILIFSTYIPLTINLLAKNLNGIPQKMCGWIFICLNMADSVGSGSRFMLVRPLAYILLILLASDTLHFNITHSFKKFALCVIFVLIIGNIIGGMYIRRLNDMSRSPINAIKGVSEGYARYVPAKAEYVELMESSEDKWYFNYLFTYANVSQYITHAVFEFPAVMDYVDRQGDYYYGLSTFMVFTKFFTKLFNLDYDINKEISSHNLRNGIWSTFFFSWYLDFGWFGIILMWPLGLFAKWVWKKVYVDLDILYLPLLLFFTMVWSLILQLNYIQGSGTYAICMFLFLGICFRQNIYNVKYIN